MKKHKNKSYQQIEWLTPQQVAENLQYEVRTILLYIRQGKIAAIKLGREYRIHREVLEAFKNPQNERSVQSVKTKTGEAEPKVTKTTEEYA